MWTAGRSTERNGEFEMLPFVILFYVAGILAYAYWLVSSVDSRFKALAKSSTQLAAGMTLGLMGSAVIWPLAALIIAYFRFAPPEPPPDVDIEGIVATPDPERPDLAAIELPPPPPCGCCGNESGYGSISRYQVTVNGFPGEHEIFYLCDDCFDAVTEDMQAGEVPVLMAVARPR